MSQAIATLRLGGQGPSRALVLSGLVAACAAFLTYLVAEVPVVVGSLPEQSALFTVVMQLPGGGLVFSPVIGPSVPRAFITQYWTSALAGAFIVLCVDSLAVAAAWVGRSRQKARDRLRPAPGQPSPLRLERVPLKVAAITGVASLTLFLYGVTQGKELWMPVLYALVPWVPLLAVEAIWKYEHYGLWSAFAVITLLQTGHMGEHTTQVVQLMLYDGDLARSHGVFGQLDFETVHFVWDSLIWLSLCALLYRFSAGNRWLWVAFAAASLHQVEHFYLIWIYSQDPFLYSNGGFMGIMGNGGLIGSPLDRPYLHFAYNFLVTLPMVMAFWDQSKRVYDRTAESPKPVPASAPATP